MNRLQRTSRADEGYSPTHTKNKYIDAITNRLGICAEYKPMEERKIVAAFSWLSTTKIDQEVKFASRADREKKMDTHRTIPVQNLRVLVSSFPRDVRTSSTILEGLKRTPISALTSRERKTVVLAKRAITVFFSSSPSRLAQTKWRRQMLNKSTEMQCSHILPGIPNQ
jgi:hypothetical protein